MKPKFYLMLMAISATLLGTHGNAVAKYARNRRVVQRKSKNLCYCSDKCGPRKVRRGDTPFFDKEHGVCFCKQRDKDNYIPNRCDKKPKEDFTSVCEQKNKN